MAEYIEREAAEEVFRNARKSLNAKKYDYMANEYLTRDTMLLNAEQIIHVLPAADVRPVVLCRDCVNYVESDESNGEKMCVIDAEWCEEDGCYYGFTAYTEPDWFCAGGIKREES